MSTMDKEVTLEYYTSEKHINECEHGTGQSFFEGVEYTLRIDKDAKDKEQRLKQYFKHYPDAIKLGEGGYNSKSHKQSEPATKRIYTEDDLVDFARYILSDYRKIKVIKLPYLDDPLERCTIDQCLKKIYYFDLVEWEKKKELYKSNLGNYIRKYNQ